MIQASEEFLAKADPFLSTLEFKVFKKYLFKCFCMKELILRNLGIGLLIYLEVRATTAHMFVHDTSYERAIDRKEK